MVGYGPARDNAERVACISHMRAIHGALAEYIQDKGMWPQEPETGSDQMLNEDWWITTLAPYDITPAIWICPAIKRLTSKCDPAEVPRLSYLPGMFDATPTAPFKFATQPWLLERASAHRRGPNVCYPDGSIHTMDELLGKQ